MSARLPVGDVAGFGRLVDAHRSMVCSIALSIVRDVATSEDVAQEVFLAAWQQLDRLRNPASLVPWLRQITRNRATDRLRRRPVEALTDDPPADLDLEDAALSSERRQVLADVLDALPEDGREVILLYYREGRSVRQVASLLDLSEAAIKQRLSRARKRIREDVTARFSDIVRDTAPTAAFTLAVTSAISVAAPSVAAASVVSKASATASKSILGGALLGPLLGVAGVLFGTRRAMRGAQTDDERRALRRTAWVGSAHILSMCLIAMLLPHEPVWLWSWFAVMFGGLVLIYGVWVPKIVAPRLARERLTDPTAPYRHRLQRIASWVGLLLGAGFGACGIAMALAAG